MKSEQEQIEELTNIIMAYKSRMNATDGGYTSHEIAEVVIKAGYRLPESEKKECEHISGGLGACPKCGETYDKINSKQPTPAAEGIVWPYNPYTEDTIEYDAFQECREAFMVKIKEIGL